MNGETVSPGVVRITHITFVAALVIAVAALLVLWQVRHVTLVSACLSGIIAFFFSAVTIGIALSMLSPILLKSEGGDR